MADGTFTLMPPEEGLCQVCATDHPAELPHNAQSLYYQIAFQAQHGRWPNWLDAMEHCAKDIRAAFTQGLVEIGVDVASGEVNPPEREAAHG